MFIVKTAMIYSYVGSVVLQAIHAVTPFISIWMWCVVDPDVVRVDIALVASASAVASKFINATSAVVLSTKVSSPPVPTNSLGVDSEVPKK